MEEEKDKGGKNPQRGPARRRHWAAEWLFNVTVDRVLVWALAIDSGNCPDPDTLTLMHHVLCTLSKLLISTSQMFSVLDTHLCPWGN